MTNLLGTCFIKAEEIMGRGKFGGISPKLPIFHGHQFYLGLLLCKILPKFHENLLVFAISNCDQ